MAVTFANTTFGAGQFSTGAIVPIVNTYAGSNVLSTLSAVTIDGTATTPGSGVTASLNLLGAPTPVTVPATYAGFSGTGANTVYYFAVTVPVAGVPTPVTVAVSGSQLNPVAVAQVNVSNVTAPVSPLPCYVAGTLIRTPRGDVAVEDLAVGDTIVTASGAHRPITWLGHRSADCAHYEDQAVIQPIRIRAGAIAPGMPARDLRVSPDHALFFDDVLIQARFLVNGTTIVRDAVSAVTYWHVELESHDVLIAENMPAESYLDVGNRRTFEGGTVIALRPGFAGGAGEGHCAPLVHEGDRLHAVRGWLAERARHLGARTTADSGLHLLADGVPVAATIAEGERLTFAIPMGVTSLRLVSHTGVPAELTIDSVDTRRLGLCVSALEVDGEDVALDDARLTAGWHDPEAGWRWTTGEAMLPLGRTITLVARGLAAYPAPAEQTPTPLRRAVG